MNFIINFKKENKSALIAAIVNTIISIIKGVAYFFTGNVAMFAETMHSIGDAATQYFVFIGSALSKKCLPIVIRMVLEDLSIWFY